MDKTVFPLPVLVCNNLARVVQNNSSLQQILQTACKSGTLGAVRHNPLQNKPDEYSYCVLRHPWEKPILRATMGSWLFATTSPLVSRRRLGDSTLFFQTSASQMNVFILFWWPQCIREVIQRLGMFFLRPISFKIYNFYFIYEKSNIKRIQGWPECLEM